MFRSTDGTLPERDRKVTLGALGCCITWCRSQDLSGPFAQGELAFRAVSYTPWPVEQGFEGERIRIGVGAVREPQLRTYVFEKCALLWQPPCELHNTLSTTCSGSTMRLLFW